MSVDYTAVLAIGKEFESASEAEQFLRDNDLLQDVSEQDIYDSGLSECLPAHLEGSCLNYYTGYGYYIGYGVSCRDTESFRKDFESGMEEWEQMFPDTPAEVIHTVIVS